MDAFVALHIERTGLIYLSGSAEEVFPLFGPIEEKKWAEGWNPQMLYPDTGELLVGAVFITLDHKEQSKVYWTMLEYDPVEKRAGYFYANPASHTARIKIHCQEAEKGTAVSVIYELTGLTERGNQYISEYSPEYYREYLGSWERAINSYLQHGYALPHH